MRIAAALLALSLVPAGAQPREDLSRIESIHHAIRETAAGQLSPAERADVIRTAAAIYRNNVCDLPGQPGDIERIGSALSALHSAQWSAPRLRATADIMAVLLISGSRQQVCRIVNLL